MNNPLTTPNSNRSQRILVVEDDSGVRESVQCLLQMHGYETSMAETAETGLHASRTDVFDLIITDLRLPDSTGLEVIRTIKESDQETPIILMTSYSSMESAVQALRLGATDYIIKPFDNTEFIHSVNRALDERRIRRENKILKRNLEEVNEASDLAGESPAMREVLDMISRVAPSDAHVLIHGESGTGKELVARAIHAASNRADGPFVAINCGAIPADLIESELFGHAKGAYTGATTSSEGFIREAHGGTLLLDEISEMPYPLQVKLLRLIQEREVRPLGATRSYQVDVRFLAATNRSIQDDIKNGSFREDLYFRLNVINIRIPPLRERSGDVELLARRFIDRYARKMGKRIDSISPDLASFLRRYHWPGNVRELENLIERAIILSDTEVLNARHLPELKTRTENDDSTEQPLANLAEPLTVEEYIKAFILRYQHEYNETELARLLGIGRKALWTRRKRWGLFRNERSVRGANRG